MRAVEPVELAGLEHAWGATVNEHHLLDVAHPFLTGPHQRLVSDGRRAEICYVMHRGNPDDGVLLHIKTIYPTGAFRLPTGGIHRGEGVTDTLAREIFEETGLSVGHGVDDVLVERFLGVLHYTLRHPVVGVCEFATYQFLVQMPAGAVLAPQDPAEMIGGWQWCPRRELDLVADNLEQIGRLDPIWADWGRFRALCHRYAQQRI